MSLYIKGINSLPVGDYKIFVFEDTDGIKKIMVDLCHEENGLRVGDYKLLNFDEISTPLEEYTTVKNLDEAIDHCFSIVNSTDENICAECKAEHLRLCGWLGELKRRIEDEQSLEAHGGGSISEERCMNKFEYIKTLSLSQLASFLNIAAPVCMGTDYDCKEALEYWLSTPIGDNPDKENNQPNSH